MEIAAMSAELGSLEAVFDRLDAERAQQAAEGRARRDRVNHALEAIAWRAQGERAYRAWRAAPLQVPDWLDGQGWPEPGGGA